MPIVEIKKKKLLFIHIPKTGGTSIEKWMGQLGPLSFRTIGTPNVSKCTPQHYRMQDFRDLFEDGFFDIAFTFVRNPYDRIESEYRMQAVIQADQFWKEAQKFSAWLQNHLAAYSSNRFLLDNHIRPQWEFIGSRMHIFKFEDGLHRGVEQVCNLIGIEPPPEIPHLLASENQARVGWDSADRLLVQEFYRKDFEHFGYEF